MGVMHSLAPVEPTPLVFTPHPVTLDGQQFIPAELREGETLGAFLDRTIDLGADAWEVKVGGVVVPVEHWDRVKPKHGHLIEVRGAVKKQALYIVAMIALTYFTMGAGATWAGALGATGFAATAVYTGAFIVGSMLINKVLGPKPPKISSDDRESVYNIAGARNAVRPHEPLGLLFGSTRIAPDIISMPYAIYQGNDQYLHFILTPGLNVDRFDDLYLGDTLLSSYEGVQVWTAGFPGMPEQPIPIYTNADTVAGGELDSSTWVERTTSPDAVQVMVNLEYMLGGVGTSGKKYYVNETVEVQYRPAGGSTWTPLTSRSYRSNKLEQRRDTITANVPKGQYDIRVRITGTGDYTGDNTHYNDYTWSTLVSVQEDTTDYRGIPRIGVKIKATGQLNGTPDQIRAVFHQRAMPVWTGSEWATATDRASGLSNPGALILAYARGLDDPDGNLVAGIGLPDSMIDIPALQAFTLHCAAKGYTYDHWMQSPRSHSEVVESIALAGFGQVTWAGGKLSVVWAADGQPLSGVVNMATMKRGTFEVDYNLVSSADGIEYTYFDRDTWQSATIRVPAPGVVTMLNPARLTGEGVTTEAHAAQLARYHLAQHLYQFKSIGFSTDLEHMSYRRLSRLALQHDMTKWGRGGRVLGAVEDGGGTVTLTLDEPVAPPSAGTSYIGLRIPGERVYRVFEVDPFAAETDTITLTEPWPAGVPLPGSSEANPAHDTIWVFDFKATPGYTVRVVSIEPESGLKGARISVVPESAEFWTYVETGHYEPPVPASPVNNRPIASGLVVTENQYQVGSGEYTELTATFDISGHATNCVVFAGLVGEPLEEVAQTATRTASWRIDEPGEYSIVVRPFDADGNAGVSVSGTYITIHADTPPPVFDVFDVIELSGGVRKYVWGYNNSTMQAANLAGAEIRYQSGSHPAPVWDDMDPLGEGFFTAAFEMVLPPSGVWTFAIRARNTSGTLSLTQRVLVKTFGGNLGEIVDGITQDQIDLQDAIDQEIADRILADIGLADDIASAQAQVNVVAAQVADILEADVWLVGETYPYGDLVQHSDKLYRSLQDGNTGNPPDTSPAWWEYVGDYTSLGEAVAASISMGTQNASAIEAQSTRIDGVVASIPASTSIVRKGTFEDGERGLWPASTTEVVDVVNHPSASQGLRISGTTYEGTAPQAIPARPGDIVDVSIDINSASATGSVLVLIHWIDASGGNAGFSTVITTAGGTAGWQIGMSGVTTAAPEGTVSARIGINRGSSGTVTVTNIRAAIRGDSDQKIRGLVADEVAARVSGDGALSNRIGTVEARMPAGSGELATTASVNSVETASVNRDNALASDLEQVQIAVGDNTASVTELSKVAGSIRSAPVILDPSFERRDGSWTLGPDTTITYSASAARTGNYYLDAAARTGTRISHNAGRFRVSAGDKIRLWSWMRWGTSALTGGTGSTLGMRFFDEAGDDISANQNIGGIPNASITNVFQRFDGVVTVPAGAAYANIYVAARHTGGGRLLVDDVGAEFITDGESEFLASHTLSLNVNGKISGYRSVNDGTVSEFDILADVFRVTGGTVEGMEWRDGYLRVYGSGYQSITGYNFGAAGEGLVRWFGPNIGAAACTKANGTIWESKDGTAYFGGDVLQGVLRYFESSTTVSPTASIATGVINTKNKTVAVRGNFTYAAQQADNGNNSTFTPDPNTSTRATIVLERRYRNVNETGWDAWVELATRDLVGGSAVLNQTGDPSYMYWDIEGSISATDVSSPRRREYRIRLTNFVRQGFTQTNPGTKPPMVENQYQSIESME